MVAHDVFNEISFFVEVVLVTVETLEELADVVIRGEMCAHVSRCHLTARLQTLLPASRKVLVWVEIALGDVPCDVCSIRCSMRAVWTYFPIAAVVPFHMFDKRFSTVTTGKNLAAELAYATTTVLHTLNVSFMNRFDMRLGICISNSFSGSNKVDPKIVATLN